MVIVRKSACSARFPAMRRPSKRSGARNGSTRCRYDHWTSFAIYLISYVGVRARVRFDVRLYAAQSRATTVSRPPFAPLGSRDIEGHESPLERLGYGGCLHRCLKLTQENGHLR